MFGAVAPCTFAPGQKIIRKLKRAGVVLLISALALLLMACPERKQTSTSLTEAERGLRLAININEVAYNSWNKVYEHMGQFHRTGKISEARWAAINAIDGVIVLSEADLIEGIERSKKLLNIWRQSTLKVLSAESQDEVNTLRERETEARRNFDNSIEFLNLRSLKLRDSYHEAMNISAAIARDGHVLPSDSINAIRGVIRLVDEEVAKIRKGEKSDRLASREPQPSMPVTNSQQAQKTAQKPALVSKPKTAPTPSGSRARSVKPEARNWTIQRP
jgi:hypothetical protein